MDDICIIRMVSLNPSNQFLVDYFQAQIARLMENQASKLSSVYRRALQSILKYPLPIICRDQILSLRGIGESLSESIF